MPSTKPNPNFFAGSPLNRLSWLRPSHPFLNALVLFPATRWIIFNGGQPLVVTASSDGSESATNTIKHQLAHVSTDDVLPLLGPQPFFGQAEEEGQLVPNSIRTLGSIRHRGPRIVFLGLQQTSAEAGGEPNGDGSLNALTLSPEDHAEEQAVAGLERDAVFLRGCGRCQAGCGGCDAEAGGGALVLDGRPGHDGVLGRVRGGHVRPGEEHGRLESAEQGERFGPARCLGDIMRDSHAWGNFQFCSKFCPACGASTHSMWGGWKISCDSLLPWFDRTGRRPCPTESAMFYLTTCANGRSRKLMNAVCGHCRRGLHNFMHPRTDSVVITVAIDQSGEKILLGKNVRSCHSFIRINICTRESCRKSFLGGSFLLSQDSWSQANRSRTPSEGKCGKKPVSPFGMFGIIPTSHGSVTPSYMSEVSDSDLQLLLSPAVSCQSHGIFGTLR